MTINTKPELKSLNDAVAWAETLTDQQLLDNLIAHAEAVVAYGTEHQARDGYQAIQNHHRIVRNGIEDVIRQRMKA